MQWMEIINARMTDPSVHREITELFGDIHSQMNSKMKQQVKLMIYRNNLIENDWSIHLNWTGTQKPKGKSELGVKLAELLRPFALVDHNVWVEAKVIGAGF